MTAFPFAILMPEKRVYDGEVFSVTVTGMDGLLTVLAGHAPMLALLAEGPIVIRTARGTIEGVTGRGMLRVDQRETAVLVRALQWAHEEEEAPPAEDVSREDALL